MIITPSNIPGSGTDGMLYHLTVDMITDHLGFLPNVSDDPNKVVNSWGFTVNGIHCGIWDWKDSHEIGEFHYSGPKEIMIEIFGPKCVD